MSDETYDLSAPEREYTLDELSSLANVSPRTVRYYIAEDILPPPTIGGRNAAYSQEHLDRLNAISALKAMFLPLREIRHRLNTLTPEQMRDPAYLASLSQAVAADRAMHRHMHAERRSMRSNAAESAAEYIDHIDRRQDRRGERRSERGRPRDTRPMPQASMAEPPSQTWERFPLGDDAELIVRSSKVQSMGPRLHRTLHRLRHLIENDGNEGSRS
jgi:DNA-binding transcriptional MerR regulator